MSLRGVLTGFYSKLAKMQKWQIGECSKNKGFSGVIFPIKLIFYVDGFEEKLIGAYLDF